MVISYLCNIINYFQTAYFGGGGNDVFVPTVYYCVWGGQLLPSPPGLTPLYNHEKTLF